MIRSTITACLLIGLLSLVGFIESSNNSHKENAQEFEQVFDAWDNHSYQFWNVAPMSVGNSSTLNTSASDLVTITLELSAYFHEPIFWEQGYLNCTLKQNNETLFTTVLNRSQVTHSFDIFDVTDNITITIQSTGSDDDATPEPGDFFIVRVNYQVFTTIN